VEGPQVLAMAGGPQAAAWVQGLSAMDRLDAAHDLEKAIVESELEGTFTSPEVLATYAALGGTDEQLDRAVLDEARLRRNFTPSISPAGLAVVWSRLLHVQEDLSADEIHTWLSFDMVRALAMKSETWSRFSALALSEWAAKPMTSNTEDSLALGLLTRHPPQAATVLARSSVGQDPQALVARLGALPPQTLAQLAATLVDEHTVPAGLRIALAGRAGEDVRARARAMVVRELGTTSDALAELASESGPTGFGSEDDDGDGFWTPAGWVGLAIGVVLASIVTLGLKAALFFALIFLAIAWLSNRSGDDASES
jgi:hypothetical protein